MSYLLVFLAISLLITLHEAGHFLAAKWVGIPIARFSVGFGRRLWGFRCGQTEYRLSLIPCGGYVLPALEHQGFGSLPLRKRIVFALGGPLSNIAGSVICLSIINISQHGLSVDGALVQPLKDTWQITFQMVTEIPQLFSNPGQLSGIVGIVAIGGEHVGTSIVRLLHLCVLLNINLAILNLLPLPPLDGGKIVMGVLEKVCPPLGRLEVPLAVTGWILLMGLMVYATVLDIFRIAESLVT
ncbi:MAG: site-2 protease family protein [Chloroflexota bacterium]